MSENMQKKRKNVYRKGVTKSSTRLASSSFRTLRNFRRLLRTNFRRSEPVALLTLTMAEVLSYETSCVLFHRFITRLRRNVKVDFRYVAVPEFQKRGAVHWHIILFNFPLKYAEEERTSRYIQRLWLRGFVDCIKTDGQPRLVSYLAKYMQKSMFDLGNSRKRSYYASNNILRPLSIGITKETYEIVSDEISPSFSDLIFKRSFNVPYMGLCKYSAFDVGDSSDFQQKSFGGDFIASGDVDWQGF